MHIHLDPVGGIAGDMFIAAVVDAFPELQDGLERTLAGVGLPPGVRCIVEAHRDGALTGRRFRVTEPEAPFKPEHHVAFSQIRANLNEAPLDAHVRECAISIFTLLAEAEAGVHGIAPEKVSFHEVGAWDSIADVVGAAYLIEALAPASWSVGALPLGGQEQVRTAHGLLPVPAPATVRLLEGFRFRDDRVGGERVTPTGAAIVRHVAGGWTPGGIERRLGRSGHGFGTRKLTGMSNVLRVLTFEDVAADPARDMVAVIAFDIDDQSGEDLATGLDRLRTHQSVVDVTQAAALGKKGRLVTRVEVLATVDRIHEVSDLCFQETSTIGLRYHIATRAVLPRETARIDAQGYNVCVKTVQRPGSGISAKVEMDDLAQCAGGKVERDEVRRQAEKMAVRKAGKHDVAGSDTGKPGKR